MRLIALACLGLAFALAGGTQLYAAQPETTAAQKATDYIRTLQNADGGFRNASAAGPSSVGQTLEATFAFAAFGVSPVTVKTNGQSPADFLATQTSTFAATPGGTAKLVVGLATMKLDPATFGGLNPLALMDANYAAATGAYGTDVYAQSFFMLADAALGRSVPPKAAVFLESLQLADGGWEYCCGYGEDTNATALAIRALIGAGIAASDTHVTNGLAYLKASQQTDGGFTFGGPGSSDPDSTAYAIQAIVAAGQNVDGAAWDKGGGKTPLSALKAFQNAANGAIQYGGVDSALATYQGVAGLMLSAFPEQATFGEGARSTNTSTSTSTATATATATPENLTPSATAHIKTATKTSVPSTATPAATSTSAAQKTPASGLVAGIDAAPPRIAAVAGAVRVPNTGSGSPSGSGPPKSAIAMLLTGGGLLAAVGVLSARKRRGTM